MTSAISYFSSTAYQNDPPGLVIWEAPAYYDLNRATLDFRQILPAANGACDLDLATAVGSGEIRNAPVTLSVPPAANASGRSHFVFFEAENRAFVRFSIQIDYADGDREDAPIDRSDRHLNEGRFFLEFSPDIPSAVTAITVTPRDDVPTAYRLRVCKAATGAGDNG